MDNKTKIPSNYKNSPLGLLPNDWEVMGLGEIGDFKNGINKDKEEFGHGYPFVGLMDVFDIPKVYTGEFSLVNTTENERRDFDLQKGDVLFVRSSVKPIGVGLSTLVCQDMLNTTFSGFLIRFRENGKLDFEYKAHCFYEENFRQRLLNKSTISANTNINQVALKSLKIPIPPLPEQKAIASLLSTWDAAIQNNAQLIAQKEQYKKWLMQQLLMGKKRLSGFKDEIKLKVVGQFLKEISERNKESKVSNVLSVTNSRGFINQSDQFDRAVASEDASNYKVVKKGQFAYNPSRVNVGSLDLLRNFEEGILSPMYVVFSTDEKHLLADFLYFQLKTQWFYGHIPMFIQGSVRDSLSFDGLCSMKFFMPSIEEQTAITQVLQAADKEIQLLKAKNQQLRLQKKGLMQVLLTGKKRLKYEL